MQIFIYGLVDPETKRIRYVGQSVNPEERLATHRSSRILGEDSLGAPKKPELIILQESTAESASDDEVFWIRALSSRGDLVNVIHNSKYVVSTKREIWLKKDLAASLDDMADELGVDTNDFICEAITRGFNSINGKFLSAAVSLGSRGGTVAAMRMSPERRKERASIAAKARWARTEEIRKRQNVPKGE